MNVANPIVEAYQKRREARQALASALERKSDTIGNYRLVAFAGFGILTWLAIRGTISAWWIAFPMGLFAGLVLWHDRLRRAITQATRAVALYEWGIARAEDRWHGYGRKGEGFRNADHVYAEDLDLFGAQSLFQLLSTARTRMGEQTLAEWLLAPAPLRIILDRQKAVEDLRGRIDLREQLAVVGEDVPAEFDPSMLLTWAEGPELLHNNLLRIVAPFLGLIALTAIAVAFWKGLYFPAAIVLFAEALIYSRYRRRIEQVMESVEGSGESLVLFSELLGIIEKQNFASETLRRMHAELQSDGMAASEALSEFSTRADLVDSRHHILLRLLNIPILYDLQVAFAVEAWRRRHGHKVRVWLNAVGEMEALISLATFAHEHPADPFPDFIDSATPEFTGESLGHVLIPAGKCVRNSVHLDATTRVLVVSGSNMSGKSTYLRTIGSNTVLAMAGAPVRAKRLRLTPLDVGSSLHVVDSLQTGRSGFASELHRLQQILAMMNQKLPVIFLLDELLHGTNSHDRAIGSQALLRAFVEQGAIGVVTTHDLSLTRIPLDQTSLMRNMHFEDRVEDGHMVFDYVLRDGPVTRSNALELMRSIGLDV